MMKRTNAGTKIKAVTFAVWANPMLNPLRTIYFFLSPFTPLMQKKTDNRINVNRGISGKTMVDKKTLRGIIDHKNADKRAIFLSEKTSQANRYVSRMLNR